VPDTEKENEESQLARYGELIGQTIRMARQHVFEIYPDESLKVADKKLLKDFYLEHIVRPAAQEIFDKYFPTRLRVETSTSSESIGTESE
jgi:hypothetical protein